MKHEFEIHTSPPRWWRRKWKAYATRVGTTDGIVRIEGVRRFTLTATGDSDLAALDHVRGKVDRWASEQAARRRAEARRITHEVHT